MRHAWLAVDTHREKRWRLHARTYIYEAYKGIFLGDEAKGVVGCMWKRDEAQTEPQRA